MRPSILIGALVSAVSISASYNLPPRDHDNYDYHVLHLDSSSTPADLAKHFGFRYDGPLGPLDDHHIFRAAKQNNDIVEDSIQELRRRRRRKRGVDLEPHILDSILLNQKQKLSKRLVKRGLIPRSNIRARADDANEDIIKERAEVAKSLSIADPIFNEQWHLYNTGQPGHDLNVTGVWLQGITGKGATVCIIDDGLDMFSRDLQPNYFGEGSYDFNDQVDEPKPRLSDDQHGTRCAGEVAAAKNDVCGVGVAYDSKVSGVRILSKAISDVDEALSVVYEYQKNDIYSCSWGPPDDGRTMEAPGILIQRAMVKAVREGRQGNGTIYVFAAGNGAASEDNCNFDGYTNSIYSVTVGAIDMFNKHPYYSEKCSAQLVVTYSSGSTDAIHTTDVGVNKCTKTHGGTSAAGPLAAGVYALLLSVRPDLSWRDIQWLTVMTAVPFYEEPSDWQDTKLGKKFSHQFGYGKLDTWAIVEAAKTWKNVKPQAWSFSPWIHVKTEIPQGDQGLHSTFEVTKEGLKKSNLERLEHVTVTMNVEHTRRGDLSVELRSPTGLVSHLATTRKWDEAPRGYVDWTFMSVVHWGEDGIGNWTVIVKDTVANQNKGTFTDWKLKLWGEAIDASAARPLPMPDEHDDDNHDSPATTTAHVSTGSVSVPTNTADLGDPASHPTRPAIAKPTDGSDPTATIPSQSPATSTSTSPPNGDTTQTPPPKSDHDHLLPSIFPTFGVSKSTQIWIYGSLSIILIFITSLLTYFFMQRRKRARNMRDEYQFEMVDAEDDEEAPLAGGGVGGKGGKKKKGGRRGGELYDAFAGESDEDLFSEEGDDVGDREREREGARYRDDDEGGSEEDRDEKLVVR
ncbi:hypothetical protein EJ08DRAFT_373680 [Tothia fuscella]|uniref:P/Homo B domain-containing protein n=1 Tax=Tothia fuscella TaxID=1048955 RepID=A0A9P4NM09_9PEZI|nr:hypothetical protein EJ08DRAFT_373680 [Tothia fuscella]